MTTGTAIRMGGMAIPIADTAGLLKLAAWLSPAFPVGGFTYSHGLEWAIEDGTVTDAATLSRWLGDILTHGAGRADAILFAAAHGAAHRGDGTALAEILSLSVALAPSRERHLEATAQGNAFAKAIGDVYGNPAWQALVADLRATDPALPWTYPVAVATAAASHEIPVTAALTAYLQAFAANIVSAGVRAIPLGQTDGLRIVAALAPAIDALAATALASSLEDLGGASLRADIASMKHETQYTRLFRS